MQYKSYGLIWGDVLWRGDDEEELYRHGERVVKRDGGVNLRRSREGNMIFIHANLPA